MGNSKRFSGGIIPKAVGGLIFLLASAAVLLACVMMAGCSPKTVYVPQERVVTKTDTVYSAQVRVDSVIFRDSVTLMQRGDTVYLTKYRDRYRVKERIDTVYRSATDSVKVRVPYPVERELTKWEKTKMGFGGGAIAVLCIAALAGAFVWFMRTKRRKQ